MGNSTAPGSRTPAQPRREAYVLRLEELTDEQSEAARKVHDLLRGFAARPHKKLDSPCGVKRFLPHIDKERWNQNLLLDGGRGSGKTALLVTLLDHWSATFQRSSREEADLESADKDFCAKRDAWGLKGSEWPVVPVGIVDLQPLPEHTPVMLHIAERLARVVEAIEDGQERHEASPPWHLADRPTLESRKRWDALCRSIISDWDGAAAERRSNVDLEASVHEIDRAVREHQDLVTQFSAFIDALLDDFSKLGKCWTTKPLFVLALDDADMNLGRAGEILETLRILQHQRVVFLLTGDSELFYRVAEEYVARQLRSPRAQQRSAGESTIREDQASRLGHDIYDKVIPLTHRCQIPAIPAHERYRRVPKLCELEVESRRASKHTFAVGALLKDPMVGEALPERIRQLRDLELLVTQTNEAPDKTLVRAVLHLWRRAIERVSEYPRPHLQSRVREGDEGATLRVDALDPPPIAHVTGRWVGIDVRPHEEGDVSLEFRGRLAIRGLMRAGEEVPTGVLGALMLADHVAFEHGIPRGEEKRESAEGFSPVFARALYHRSFGGDPLVFEWPLPDGHSLLDLALVNFRWARSIDKLASPDKLLPDVMARRYLVLVAQLAPDYPETFPLLAANDPAPAWDDVVERVVWVARNVNGITDREAAFGRWARGLAPLLAAPEYGLPREASEAFLVTLQRAFDATSWTTIKDAARAERSRFAEVALKSGTVSKTKADPVALLARIDGTHSNHPWSRFVGFDDSATPVARFIVALLQAQLLRVRGGTPQLPPGLEALDTKESALLDRLTKSISDALPLKEAQPYIFAWLWQDATTALGTPEVANVIRVPRRSMEIKLLKGRFERGTPAAGRAGALTFRNAPRYRLTNVLDDSASRITVTEAELSPLLQLLYAIAWDWRANAREASRSPFFARWTDMVTASLDNHDVHVLWPSAPWRIFSQYGQVSKIWDKTLSTLFARRAVPIPEEELAELVALSFFETSGHYRYSDDLPNDAVNLGLSAQAEVKSKFPQYARLGDRGDVGALRDRVRRWCLGLVLLIAPESKTPPDLLTALRDALLESAPPAEGRAYRVTSADLADIHTARLDRMKASLAWSHPKLDASKLEPRAKKIIKAVDADASAAKHLWFDFIAALEKVPAPTPTQS